MSEELNNDYKIRVLTIEDQSAIQEFLKNFFFTDEPLNNALSRGLSRPFLPEYRPIDYLSEGLSLAAVALSGEIIGLVLNSKADNRFNKPRNENSNDPYVRKIARLLDHLDEQITLQRTLNDNDTEMEARVVTVHDKWRNKGIGKKLLKQIIFDAFSREVARLNGFKYIRSICTSAYSTKLFLNYGFKVVYRLNYKDCKNDGKIDFIPENPHTHINGMILDLK